MAKKRHGEKPGDGARRWRVVKKRDTGVLCALQAEARLPAGRQARTWGESPIICRLGRAA